MLSSVNNNLLISGVAGKLKDDLMGTGPANRSKKTKSGLIMGNASHAQQIPELLQLRNINSAISKLQYADYALKSLHVEFKSMHEIIKHECTLGNTIDDHVKERILQLNKQLESDINLIEFNELNKFIHEIPIQAYIGRGFFMDLKTRNISFNFKKALEDAEEAKIEIKRQQERLEEYREMLGIAKNAFSAAIESFKQYQIEGQKLQNIGSAEDSLKNIIKQIDEDCLITSKSHSGVQADTVMKLTAY